MAVATSDPVSASARGPLCQILIDLCGQAGAEIADREAAAVVASVKAGLESPLRVALAGRVSSGKSTIVNALVGQRVAATDVGECTRVVTRYQYGALEHAALTRRDGTSRPLPLTSDGMLPAALGEDPDGVSRIDVWLSSALLEQVTIIDTPGLESLSGASETTRELLRLDRDSRSALSEADALLFVMAGDAHEDDIATLDSFARLTRGLRSSSVNAVGVLNKIDKIGGGAANAAELGAERAGRLAGKLRAYLATVVPLVGLLAETADTGALGTVDARALERIAALDEVERELLLLSVDRFAADEERRRLVRLLDLTGVRLAVAAIVAGDSVADTLAGLRETSRIRGLREAIELYFASRVDALKAETAVTALDGIAWARISAPFAAKVGELMLDARMHGLRELRARQAAADPELFLGDDLVADLDRLVTETTLRGRLGLPAAASPDECREAAVAGSLRWAAYANSGQAGPAAQRIADVARRSYDLMWQEAEGSAVPA
jgi:GTP-binding protein EngB required for normal cell division